jgi:hypothetical protein
MKIATSRPGLGVYSLLPFLGLLALSIPTMVNPHPWYDAPLLSFVRTAVEGMAGWSVILLFAAAAVVGARVPQINIALASPALLIVLPVVTFAELFVDPKSHNLWPLEIALYLVLTLVPAAGLRLGRLAATTSQSGER